MSFVFVSRLLCVYNYLLFITHFDQMIVNKASPPLVRGCLLEQLLLGGKETLGLISIVAFLSSRSFPLNPYRKSLLSFQIAINILDEKILIQIKSISHILKIF